MNLDSEDQRFAEQRREGQKKDIISYTRDFFLSLSELDVCKKLPSEFDPSILCEFEGFFHTLQDRQRPGSLSSQSFRRTEYDSSPPTRGDSSIYSRGIHGRWDSRSRDSDSQSDWDSDSGRRYGNQSHRSWQNTEHDGLLGSGSFARPSGYASGASAPKTRANDPGQLIRSNEPYQPPRPYKAVPHSRRDTRDLYNDETFGSAETSEDRAEEERMRRASFELMRKEQHKSFQEKQKSIADKQKDDSVSDITVLPEDNEKLFWNRNNETDDSVPIPDSHNDSTKSLPSQTLASRPLVPPGFNTTGLEKNFGIKSVFHPHPAEVGNPKIKDCLSQAGGNPMLNGTYDRHEAKKLGQKLILSEQQLDNTNIDIPFIKMNEKFKLASEVSNRKTGMVDQSFKTSSLSEASDTIELDAENDSGQNTLTVFNEDHSTSVLEKLFGSASSVKTGESSNFTEHHDSKRDDSPSMVQSSKFAHWFLEEEKKPVDGISSGGLNDLLSLSVSGEEGRFRVSDAKATEQIPPDFPFHNSDFSKSDVPSDLVFATIGIPEQLYIGNKPEAVPTVLTCEDLEQSILSEISDNSLALEPPVQGLNVLEEKMGQVKANIDDHASQHLLSLLNKGAGLKDVASSPSLDTESLDKQHVSEVARSTALENSREAPTQKVHDLGKTLTLEKLFGTAFMNELQSFEAPVSVHRASVGPARVDVPKSHGMLFPINDNGVSQSTIDGTGSKWTGHENTILASNHRLQVEADKIEGRWLGFNDPQTELNSSKLKTEVGFRFGGFDGSVNIRLPEEDSLIMASDALNHPNSFLPAGEPSKADLLSSLNRPVGVAEKLAALNAVFKDKRSMVGVKEGPPFLRGSSQMIEPEMRYQNLHGQQASPQLHHPQINHGRPLFHPLDSHPTHINGQMKFSDGIIHHDPPSNHQFHGNMLRPLFHHPNAGLTGFEPPAHHPMQRPGSFLPSHLMQGFPGSPPLPPHPNNQVAGFIQEPDSMQGFPIGHRQPNYGGHGMPLPAPDIGGVGSHPEALQRLIEMELRSNPKQIHPLAPHGQGMYGHDLDMSFRHR